MNDFGNISETLVYSEGFKRFNMRDIGIDICIMILSFAVLIISLKFTKIALNISALVLLSILAMDGIINNPINPYLDKIISDVDKNIKEIDLYSNSKWWDAKNYLDDFIFTNYRFSCHTIDIFDKDNWYTKKEVESYD